MAEPTRLGRVGAVVNGTLFVGALALVLVVWVAMSRPFDPPRQAPPPVHLDAVTARTAAGLPGYPGSVVVLTYHAVSDADHAGSTLTRRLFGEHLAALAAAGYRTVRLADVERLIAHQPVRLPPKALLLTFDDGTLSDWTTVDPVLERYHFTAAAFLTTSKMVAAGTPSYYLSTRQLRALRATGRWEFGSHTHALHEQVPVPGDLAPALVNRILVHGRQESPEAWRSRVRADLARSQKFFRRAFGRPASAFSYPFGDTGGMGDAPALARELPGLLRDAGFGVAFVGENVPTEHVNAVSAQSPRWTLDRIGVRATTSVSDLLEMVRGAVPVAPPHDLAALSWIGDLADCAHRPGVLSVRSDGYGTCLLGEVNTSQWVDYTVRTRITGVNRHAAAVIAVRDGAGAGHRGRLEVVVGEGSIVVREQVGDAARVVLARAVLPASRAGRTVLIRVHRDTADVSVDGRRLRAAFDRRLHEGGTKFGIAAEGGRRTVVYSRPTLTPDTRRKR
ncbi:polysaccharide deacetylase family protein [Actinoallomurus spadix]|uniref:Polysaccharide deacetylase family protein n=1 Tax=Actinoallomurus spadix TaxID=79912 RepID=A0ABN0XFZ3_9ACTN|nr:polysaccharide deacetylase family protein [Actinoallomurus spadix]MCO5988975.1 polysaccharide deacetylase family protein [Actinoallomurus spadix]